MSEDKASQPALTGETAAQDTAQQTLAAHLPELFPAEAALVPDAKATEQKKTKKAKKTGPSAADKKRRKQEDAQLREAMQVDEQELKSLRRKLEKVKHTPERGIETWFRLASRNLYTRRQLLDTKANMLVTLNALVLSVVLGTNYRDLGGDPYLIISLVPLVVACLLSLTFAILASKPHIRRGVFSWADLSAHRVSLMTFEDFYAMSGKEYEEGLDQIMADRELLYGSLKRDIYCHGIDLGHRYKNIQRAYGILLVGIGLSTVVFGVCHAMYW